jgi:hypothetical protein
MSTTSKLRSNVVFGACGAVGTAAQRIVIGEERIL